MHELALPIRFLAEFVLRRGSIDARFSGLGRAAEGSRLHRLLQRRGGKGYKAEVPLRLTAELEEFRFTLTGRADGILRDDDGVLVDEIKTVVTPLADIGEDDHPAHWAQGLCYAHILCEEEGLARVRVRLRYCHVETQELRVFEREYSAGEAAAAVTELLRGYLRWARLRIALGEKRRASLSALAFPFPEYREGQRKLAVASYQAFRDGGRLFAAAPTGIGKTVSTLFPACKALGEGHGSQIFYLTAKNTTRAAARDAVRLLRRSAADGLAASSLVITAKDKACMLPERNCTPEACPYAKGYYDRLGDALYQLAETGGDFDPERLEAEAQKHKLCPYELSLDLAEWSDIVICDYNYLFDPVVHLQRFFESGGDYLFLIDEAHNLVDRSREMYSAVLQKGQFWAFKKQLPKSHKALHRALAGVNSAFVALRKELGDERVRSSPEAPSGLDAPLARFATAAELFLKEHRGSALENDLLALYFAVLFYQRIREGYDETYETLNYRGATELTVKLFCMDPAGFLNDCLAKGRAAVLFSATLAPLPYYRAVLGGGEEAKLLALLSPFPQQNLGLFAAKGISVKYADRERSLPDIADMLADMAAAHEGNYIAFFPSYAYLRQVQECFSASYPGIPVLVQQPGMDEAARAGFLARFTAKPAGTLLGFCVLGGIFGEGVDLVGDRLSGAAIIGVGLPQMGPEPDAIREYYNQRGGLGFEYAYQFPGMNRVLQAAGRVIRTEEDKGVVLLIDDRFTTPRYQQLFPHHWNHWRPITPENLPSTLTQFWANPK